MGIAEGGAGGGGGLFGEVESAVEGFLAVEVPGEFGGDGEGIGVGRAAGA